MQEKVQDIKEGIRLHYIKTDKFKTNLMTLFLTIPLKRETVTSYALIPAVLRRGTKRLPTQEAISKELENMYGATFNCGIDKMGDQQVIKFYLETVNDQYLMQKEQLLKASIQQLLEIVLNPYQKDQGVDPDYVEGEKKNLKQIIEAKIDNKNLYAMNRCIEEMFQGYAYSLYKYGYTEDLSNIDAQKLYQDYQRLLQTAKIDIFLSGDFSYEEAKSCVCENSYIQGLQPRSMQDVLKKDNQRKKHEEIQYVQDMMDVTQGKLVIGMDVENAGEEKDCFSTIVYNTILGDSANSKLFQNVREKAHLAYTTRSNYSQLKQTIFIRAGIEIANYQKAYDIIQEQLEDMKQGKFTEDELKNAKNTIMSSIDAMEEEQDSEIIYYFGQELSQRFTTPAEYKERVQAIQREDVIRVANQMKINTVYFLKK